MTPHPCWLCGRPAEHDTVDANGWLAPMQTIRGAAVCEACFLAVDDNALPAPLEVAS
jgi:hypothetical protein